MLELEVQQSRAATNGRTVSNKTDVALHN